MLERFKQSFRKQPLAWILGGLLALSVYWHYQTGTKFSETCLAITALMEGYWEPNAEIRLDPSKIERLCGERLAEPDQYDDRE